MISGKGTWILEAGISLRGKEEKYDFCFNRQSELWKNNAV